MTSWDTGVLAKMIINKTKDVALLLYPTTLLNRCQFPNDFLKLPMTSWNHAWNTGVLAKMISKKNRCVAQYIQPHSWKAANFANDILEHRCTGQDDYKQKNGGGLVIISNHAHKKMPISSWNCQWLPGVANDILEHRCTHKDDHTQNNGRGFFIISNHALEKLPICQWHPGAQVYWPRWS